MPTRRTSATKTRYTLHLYDHCPSCASVELVLGWKGIPYERVVYRYGDDSEDTGARAVHPDHKKELPILEVTPLSSPTVYLCESDEIIRLLEKDCPILAPPTDRHELKDWLSRFEPVQQKLCVPRIVKTPLHDWAEEDDVRFAIERYIAQGFDFESALKETDSLLSTMTSLLEELCGLLEEEHRVSKVPYHFEYGMDDVLVISGLRTLTCVRGVKWPEKVKDLMSGLLKASPKVKTFDHAYRRYNIDYHPVGAH